MIQKSGIILLGKVRCQAGIVNCSIAMLKIPVISTQMRALSHESWPLRRLHKACCFLMALQKLRLCCLVKGKKQLRT